MLKDKENSTQAYVKFDDLSVGYGGKAIINDICIDIKKGEIVALIGPNGAGKSTILKTLTKQLAIIKGDVGFEGRSMHKIPNKELSQKMAVVLTERLKTDLLTCYDVVASGRYPYTGKLGILMPEDEQKVDEAIAAVHATDLGPRDFNAISDGQRQRILLARAICQDPELIVLDEPINGLDPQGIVEVRQTLEKLRQEKGITIMISSHILDELGKLADSYGIIHAGRLMDEFTTDELSHRCAQYVLIKTGDNAKSVEVLKKAGFNEVSIDSDNNIRVGEQLDRSSVMSRAIVSAGIDLNEILVRNVSLEDYYLSVTGGAHNA